MGDRELAFAPIEALAPKLKSKDISPVDLAELALARIERHDGA